MYFRIRTPKSISYLDKLYKIDQTLNNQKRHLREQKVLIIDDLGFPMEDELKRNGFSHVSQVKEIPDIDAVKPYSIVLCDIKGVGLNLSPIGEGAHLIKQIKLLYPHIGVIAYTGGAQDRMYFDVVKYADRTLIKTPDVNEFIDCLDEQLSNVNNPILIWKKVRDALLKENISLVELADLENIFVNSFKNKEIDALKEAFNTNNSLKNLKNLLDITVGVIKVWNAF